MQIGAFRKNVMKTVMVRPAKLALRVSAKDSTRTNVANSVVSLKAHTGLLLQELGPYVLGEQMTQEMKNDAQGVLGEIGYDLTVLCRVLKVKMPSSTKKIKLVGTRTAGLLQLDGLTTNMLAVVQRSIFVGPALTKVTKTVVLPKKGGAKEERQVNVVNVAVEKEIETARREEIRSLLAQAVNLYWRLCFDIYAAPPATIFESKFKAMQKDYPGTEFDTTVAVKKPKNLKIAAAVTETSAPAPASA